MTCCHRYDPSYVCASCLSSLCDPYCVRDGSKSGSWFTDTWYWCIGGLLLVFLACIPLVIIRRNMLMRQRGRALLAGNRRANGQAPNHIVQISRRQVEPVQPRYAVQPTDMGPEPSGQRMFASGEDSKPPSYSTLNLEQPQGQEATPTRGGGPEQAIILPPAYSLDSAGDFENANPSFANTSQNATAV